MNIDDEERKRKLWNELRSRAEEEQKPQPDLFIQRSIGCFAGGMFGPALLWTLLLADEHLHPAAHEHDRGSPLIYLFLLALAIPCGGILCALLSPFIVKWIKFLQRRKRK